MRALFLFYVIAFITLSGNVFAEDQKISCGLKCHQNLQFIKEDKNTLEECTQCHNSSIQNTGLEVEIKTPVSNNNKNFYNMVHIPEGEFIMGTDDRLRDEKPAHVVYVANFWIDIYEVTNEDYKKFVDQAGYPPPDHWKGGTFPENKAKHPVVFVSWNDANNYCKWAGKRLSREIEWEKAARGTDGRVYPWGNEWDMYKSNNPLRKLDDTQSVGTFEKGKSPYGLYDMSGNVWEWVDDHYYAHPGSDYVSPEFGSKYRLLKGGSYWDCSAYGCGISAPVYNRAFFEPPVKSKSYGLRCAKDNKGDMMGNLME